MVKLKFLFFGLIILLINPGSFIYAQSLYNDSVIHEIRITFSQSNWDYQMDTAKADSESYTVASLVEIDGISFDSVGVRYKGNSSYDSSNTKNPLHLKLDYIHNKASYKGYDDIKLGNGYEDPSMIREVLAYDILRNYMDAPLCNFARVYINGVYYGLYSSSESIDKKFLSDRFASSKGSFFKANPISVINGHLPTLIYLGPDSASYTDRYDIQSDYRWQDLINLCDTLQNNISEISSVLDVDRALWMLAFNNVTVNLDSYSGLFAQNYYLYRDHNNRFIPIIWDLNMCFGGFSNTGLSNLNLAGKQTMTPLLHSADPSRPLIMNLLADSRYRKMYIAHMRTINDEFFLNGQYSLKAQGLMSMIDSSVQTETFSLFSYTQFQQAITIDVGSTPGLSNLMDARAAFLDTSAEFLAIPPSISNTASLFQNINLNDTIYIVTSGINADSVYLNYRDQSTKMFNSEIMFDDGLHNDSLAGDGIFGASIIASSALIQYYIYAENSDAGIFDPQRAEHEFYSVHVNVPTALPGEIVINEFLVINVTDTIDEEGQNEDWIEFGNRTSSPLNLFGLYLTDDMSNPTKFAFPENAVVPANGYLTIWADEDAGMDIHCNFKLSASGESIVLLDGLGNILDSVSFGQQNDDISMSRCPDDTGAFVLNTNPTFNSSNICFTNIDEYAVWNHHSKIFPNPASTEVYIVDDIAESVSVINAAGQYLMHEYFVDKRVHFDLSGLSNGLYFFICNDKNGRVIGGGKLSVIN